MIIGFHSNKRIMYKTLIDIMIFMMRVSLLHSVKTSPLQCVVPMLSIMKHGGIKETGMSFYECQW